MAGRSRSAWPPCQAHVLRQGALQGPCNLLPPDSLEHPRLSLRPRLSRHSHDHDAVNLFITTFVMLMLVAPSRLSVTSVASGGILLDVRATWWGRDCRGVGAPYGTV